MTQLAIDILAMTVRVLKAQKTLGPTVRDPVDNALDRQRQLFHDLFIFLAFSAISAGVVLEHRSVIFDQRRLAMQLWSLAAGVNEPRHRFLQLPAWSTSPPDRTGWLHLSGLAGLGRVAR